MLPISAEDFENKTRRLRRLILAMGISGGGAHVAPAYSITELCTYLFFGEMNRALPKQNLKATEVDHFILSKGHGCAILYAILADQGYIAIDELRKYCQPGGILGGHPDMRQIPGVEASTGSLGHGIVTAVGLAQGLLLQSQEKSTAKKVFCVIGDGEAQEGSVWESLLFAGNHKLSNLVVILDYNKLQGMGSVQEISSLEPAADKLKSFGFNTYEIDGHSYKAIDETFAAIRKSTNSKPSFIIAHTIKGKGLSFMEGKTIWHYKIPKGNDVIPACAELGVKIHTAQEAVSALLGA